jgi:hypothetical protein
MMQQLDLFGGLMNEPALPKKSADEKQQTHTELTIKNIKSQDSNVVYNDGKISVKLKPKVSEIKQKLVEKKAPKKNNWQKRQKIV